MRMMTGNHDKSLIILVLLFLCGQAPAQTAVTELVRKVGTLIDSMSVKGLDRRYIEAPGETWQGSMGVGYAYNLKAYGYAANVEELMEYPRSMDEDITDEDLTIIRFAPFATDFGGVSLVCRKYEALSQRL